MLADLRNPVFILAVVGAILIILAFVSRLKIPMIGMLDVPKSPIIRVAAAVFGLFCLGLSIYLTQPGIVVGGEGEGEVEGKVVVEGGGEDEAEGKVAVEGGGEGEAKGKRAVEGGGEGEAEGKVVVEDEGGLEGEVVVAVEEDEGKAEVEIDGIWEIEAGGRYDIVWEMKMSQEGDNIYAKGTKTSVLGKPATQGERNTILEFNGTIDKNTVTGSFTETQPTRKNSGKFTFEVSEDRMTLSGKMGPPSSKRASSFIGHKKSGLGQSLALNEAIDKTR